MTTCILLITMIRRYIGAISNKNADGQSVNASQTEDHSHGPSRAEVEVKIILNVTIF